MRPRNTLSYRCTTNPFNQALRYTLSKPSSAVGSWSSANSFAGASRTKHKRPHVLLRPCQSFENFSLRIASRRNPVFTLVLVQIGFSSVPTLDTIFSRGRSPHAERQYCLRKESGYFIRTRAHLLHDFSFTAKQLLSPRTSSKYHASRGFGNVQS
jgi:hypothetical protein